MRKPVRLAYLVSHPIQYQAPLLRRIAQEPDIDLTVLFGSDFSVRGYQDKGFGVQVSWDVPLLEGYKHRFLPTLRDTGTVSATAPLSRSVLGALRNTAGSPAFDALWVHGYASVNTLRGIAAAHFLGTPVLLRAESWSGDRPRSSGKLALKKAFLAALRPMVTATLPIGSHNAAYWRECFGADMPQFPVPYAVDNAFFARKAAEAHVQVEDMRGSLQLAPNRPIVLFASKLQARKHCDHLLEACDQLARRTPIRPYVLVVGDGEERPRLEQICRERQMNHVRFLGFRNQSGLPAFFALADVFVLPSRHEPWGLIVNEAMAAGCPVIVSSDVGAAPDLVINGLTGFTYPVGDVPALSEALARVLEAPETAASMGQAAARHIGEWDFEADVRGLRSAIAFATGLLEPVTATEPQTALLS